MNPKYRRHFRIYFISKHPAFIVGETKKHFFFHRVTSSPKSGHHSNWKVNPNPDPKRNTPMYIVHAEEKDLKTNFSAKLPYNAQLDFIKKKNKK